VRRRQAANKDWEPETGPPVNGAADAASLTKGHAQILHSFHGTYTEQFKAFFDDFGGQV
jgi:hypothetical protein